jgi:hypothetical protein
MKPGKIVRVLEKNARALLAAKWQGLNFQPLHAPVQGLLGKIPQIARLQLDKQANAVLKRGD